jgi:hypothetical protein
VAAAAGRHVEAFTGSARLAEGMALVCIVLDRRPPGPADGHPAADEDGRGRGGLPDQAGASFSLLTIGNLSGQPVFQIRIPHLLSLIATLSWNGAVDGITQVQNAEAARYGPGGYVPVLWVTYWSSRLMVGFGFLMLAASGAQMAGPWIYRRLLRGRGPF